MTEQLSIPMPQDSFSGELSEIDPAITHIAESANYQGSWYLRQQERMMSPVFRTKFDAYVHRHIDSLTVGEPLSPLDKPESFQSHYQRQADSFDDTLAHVHSQVGYGSAHDTGGVRAAALGHGKIGSPGTVYSDAIDKTGQPLSDRHKDIIAGHEAYHGMVDAQGTAVSEVKSGFDWDLFNALVDNDQVVQPGYLRQPDELLARMAQFKNYFGMSADEQFTHQHLDYIRQHYIEDIGLDNGISTMLGMISQKTEPRFIELMNLLPV